ncbi:hypothetical protein NIES2135_62030 (plasmid) [Leptolyngbya boryana NIES-2135]|jgi:hypothetical protein|uniref:Uncharacterized protein n=1 Tax=Leptolyngbya boryana NIES-2135 TaxID=1973484 RepID=A0A1Z4JRJ9_LEPBY|nr:MULTISPECIES: hypothetical protein [Leptolyngbya]BAY59326.1 hypothetical protein NIES2135_62030 [Leptolyngbya boryana NIES-2135]MBD2372915.1 hypothetical protein [Leptolyngbya sp. FACHB-238]MBD2397332.1 hypothetical protein [Leptolyngbya sp. FACHB-239]MBD2403863.1 hypothetical protein [Leptolyngbya sp. FACHB-402]ULP33518.1 hypothetical protein MCP04_30790 [Leptolyngbya boryana IU 594]
MSSEQDISSIEPQPTADSISKTLIDELVRNLSGRAGIDFEPGELRIQLGRRVVYGTVGKEQRSDLDEARIVLLKAAIIKPVSTELNSSEAEVGTPSTIKISVGKTVLFEQTGGVVKINAFELPELEIANPEILEPETKTELPSAFEEASIEAERPVISSTPIDLNGTDEDRTRQTVSPTLVEPISTPLQAQEPLNLVLSEVLSEQTLDIIEGKQSNQSPEASFYQVAREVNGWKNWAEQRSLSIDVALQDILDRVTATLGLNSTQTEAVIDRVWQEPVQQFSDEQSLHACLSVVSQVAEISRPMDEVIDRVSPLTANPTEQETFNHRQALFDQPETVLDPSRDLSSPEAPVEVIAELAISQVELQSPQASSPANTLVPEIETLKPSALNTIAIVTQQIEALPPSSTKQFFQRLTADIKQQAIKATTSIQQGLESEQFQSLKAKAQSRAKADTEKTLQAVGQGIASAGNWIASLPEAKREHQAAQTVLALYQYGFDRTQERAFRYEGFQVRLEGRNQFILNDQVGNLLLKFKAEKPLIGTEPRITITGKSNSGISRAQYEALELVQQTPQALRRGTDEAEQQYAQKVQFVVGVVRKLGPGKGNHFEVKQEDGGALTVQALDGRKYSEILRLEPTGRVESALLKRDVERFIAAHQKLAKSKDHSLEPVR